MLTHDHFEQLCAAAVTGQISHDDLATLQAHMETCADCRSFVGDVCQVLGPSVAEYAHKEFAVKAPKGATERFIAKAHSEGIPLKKLTSHGGWPRYQKAVVLIAVAAGLALTCLSLYRKFATEGLRPVIRTNRLPQAPAPSIPDKNNEADHLRRKNAELKELLAASSSKLVAAEQRNKAGETLASEMRSRLNSAETENSSSQKAVQDKEAQIAQLRADLDRQATIKQADDIAIQAEESELRSLRDSQDKLTSELQQARSFAAAAKDAKELIAARNLHVVDVNDVNENGKRQRPFGRVYYVEGKTLRFYAYDLGDLHKVDTKIQFYVWGEKHGVTIKTLGVLHSDNLADNRWRLDFDDPNVLAKIDTVFVTVENNQAPVTKPKGKRILDAVLGDIPNHP